MSEKKLAKDVPGFMECLIPGMNEGLNFDELTYGSSKEVWWENIYGKKCYSHICDVVRNLRDRKYSKHMFAKDVPGFTECLVPGMNEGIDLNKLTVGSEKKIWWEHADGRRSYTATCDVVSSLRRRKKTKSKPKLAKDEPGFIECLVSGMNEGINFDELTVGSGKKVWWNDLYGNKRHSIISNVVKMLRNRNKSKPKLAKEVPGFIECLVPGMNEEINFNELTVSSSTKIWWKDFYGNKKYDLTRNVVGNIQNRKKSKPKLAKDEPGFMECLVPNKNEGIDLNELAAWSETKVWWKGLDEKERYSKTREVVKNLRCRKKTKRKPKLAKDEPGFMECLVPNKNEGIDLNELAAWSETKVCWKGLDEKERYSKTREVVKNLRCRKKTKIIPKLAKGLTSSKKHISYRKDSRRLHREIKHKFAKNEYGFMDIVKPELNPDVVFDTLPFGSNNMVRFISRDGSVRMERVKIITSYLSAGKFPIGKEDNDTGSIEKKDVLYDPPKICVSYTCRKGHENYLIDWKYNEYLQNGIEPCIKCHRVAKTFITKGCKSIAEMDPELELFWNDEKYLPNEISANSSRPILLKCPHCGHDFSPEAQKIVGRHPKCPICKDEGFNCFDNMFENMPYITTLRKGNAKWNRTTN